MEALSAEVSAGMEALELLVPKCCPIGQLLEMNCSSGNRTGTSCCPSNSSIFPAIPIYSLLKGELILDSRMRQRLWHAGLNCSTTKYILGIDHPFRLLEDGSLFRPDLPHLTTHHFCLEQVERRNWSLSAVLCDSQTSDQIGGTIYSIGMLISLPFLWLTLIVYLVLPEWRNLQGKCVINLILSYIATYSLYIIINNTQLSPITCSTVAYLTQFSFLASFFWLNIISINIWSVFGEGSVRERSWRRRLGVAKTADDRRRAFLWYSCYGWGVPLLILGATLLMGHSSILTQDSPFRPRIGPPKCFFYSREEHWAYLFGPASLVVGLSLILFVITSVRMYFYQAANRKILASAESHTSYRYTTRRYMVQLKVMVLTGVSWAGEIISWAVGGPAHYWYLTDLLNSLQGVFIFLLFVCKPSMVSTFRRRFSTAPQPPPSFHSSRNPTATTSFSR